MTVRSDDLLLVNRAGTDYQTEAKNLFTPVCELDELPVPGMPWEESVGWVHIKALDELT